MLKTNIFKDSGADVCVFANILPKFHGMNFQIFWREKGDFKVPCLHQQKIREFDTTPGGRDKFLEFALLCGSV